MKADADGAVLTRFQGVRLIAPDPVDGQFASDGVQGGQAHGPVPVRGSGHAGAGGEAAGRSRMTT